MIYGGNVPRNVPTLWAIKSPAPHKQHREKGLPHAPEGTRTPNLLIRSQMLYPIELRAQRQLRTADKWCELRTTGGVQTTGFVNERYKTRTCDLHDVNVAL